MNGPLTKILVVLAAVVAGVLLGRFWQPQSTDPVVQPAERKILYWQAPMDPNYRRDQPGKSPMGMDLIPIYADDSSEGNENVVSIDPRVVHNLGIRTGLAERGALSMRVETVGYVSYDEDTLQHIHARVEGWIERLSVKTLGDPVAAGQLLFQLYSPSLVSAQEEYLAALAGRNAVLQAASRNRLAALGVGPAEIERLDRERKVSRLVSVHAGDGGYVADLGIREGMYITPATLIMSVAKLDSIWILAEVLERQATSIEAGQTAEVELDYLPGRRLQGTVDYVYPELDPKTRTLKVRLRFNNESHLLKPNMFARVSIQGRETGPVVHVPRESLIRGGKLDRVVVALGNGRYRAQAVDVGIESGDRVEIRAGLAAGDEIVTSGQFLIDSESNIDAALGRVGEMSGRPATASGPPMPADKQP